MLNHIIFLSLKIILVLQYSANPDEMPPSVVSHLVLHSEWTDLCMGL